MLIIFGKANYTCI